MVESDSAPGLAARHQGWNIAGILALLAVATAGVLHLRGFGGAFLSDDYGYLHVIAHADREHHLAQWVLARFVEPVAAGNFAYRPITALTWALDWRVSGPWAAGWRLQSLALHLASAAAVATGRSSRRASVALQRAQRHPRPFRRRCAQA